MRSSQAFRLEFFGYIPISSKTLSTFFAALTPEHVESSAPSLDSYKQIFHHFWSTDNSGCRAQPKLFVDPKRNIRMPSSFSNPCSMHFFWKIQIILVEFYKQYWPWNKNSEKVHYKSREKERKTRNALRSKPQKSRKCLWRSWNGPREFEAKDLRGSRMTLKVLKNLEVL